MKRTIITYVVCIVVIIILLYALTYVDETGLHIHMGLVQLISLLMGIVGFIAGRLSHDEKT